MLCVADPPAVASLTRVCRNCGHDLPAVAFSTDPSNADGYDRWCLDCRNAAGRHRRAVERSRRIPDVSGHSEPEPLLTAVLGALRLHYDGRPARLLADLRATLRDVDAADRVNAMLTLLTLREIGAALKNRPISGDLLAFGLSAMPDADWQALRDAEDRRRAPV